MTKLKTTLHKVAGSRRFHTTVIGGHAIYFSAGAAGLPAASAAINPKGNTMTNEMPDMPQNLIRTPETAERRKAAMAANLKPELKVSQPKPGSKLAQLKALREQAAANAEKAAEAPAPVKSPGMPGAKPFPKLKWADGVAKAKHAHYRSANDGEQFTLIAVTAEGETEIGKFDTGDLLKSRAAEYEAGLAEKGAPIYKPAKTPKAAKVEAEKQESNVSAKKKVKATAKPKAKKAPAAKKAKTASKANARKAVKGKTSARKPREAGAPSKKDLTISRLKARWTSAAELAKELGWLPHTFRGFLSGLRTKEKMVVETDRREDGTYYRIV